MANYQRVRLSELIFQNTTPEKIADMQNERYLTVALYGKGVRERVIKEGKYPVPFTGYRVSEGQFIYSRIDARNGAYGIIEPEYDGFVVSKDFPVYDIDTSRIQSQFLLMSVLGGGFLRQVKNSSFGATNRMRIKEETLESYSIILPPMEEQSRIVEIISKAQCIIDRYQRQICILDDLIKARFVEMFGEPSVNDSSYRQRQLGELVVNIIPGWSANGKSRRMQGAEKAVLKVSAVTQGVFKPEEHKALPMGTEIKKYVYPHKGDLLFSRANTRELVGATAIIDQDYPDLILPDKLWRVLFTDEINVYYAKYVLSTETIRREFSAQSTGTSGSMFNVSAEKFSAIMIPVPPIQEQELFAAFVSQVDKSKVVVQKALDEAKLLLDSLMQKYFG